MGFLKISLTVCMLPMQPAARGTEDPGHDATNSPAHAVRAVLKWQDGSTGKIEADIFLNAGS